jgi:tetratricopeptide (TPR) repeat protein
MVQTQIVSKSFETGLGAKVVRRFGPAWVGKVTVILGLTAGLGLSGCIFSPRQGSDDFENALDTEHSSDRAMSALARGDISTAQTLAQAALKRDPKDPYALLVAGQAYQAAGRYDLARQYFQVIVSNKPVARMNVPDDKGLLQLRPVVEIAQANLIKIDQIAGRNEASSVAQSGRAPGAVLPAYKMMDPETSIATRFKILRRLLDEELITPDEYSQRRMNNLGALLPMTANAPSQGLDRPVADESQIMDRLRMLKASIEAREMLPREAAGERAVILDGLLPATPRAKAIPPLPPKDVLEVADAVRRLEKLRTSDLISPDEALKEKAALDQVLEKQLTVKAASANTSGLKYGIPPVPQMTAPPAPEKKMGEAAKQTNWGVVLGIAPDEEEAKTLAAQIKSKFPEELGSKVLTVRSATIKGAQKWQIVTASEGKDGARRLCKTMRLHRQACEPTAL